MSLISLLIILIIIGAILYLIENTLPLDPGIKVVIRVVVIVCVLLYLLQLFMGFGPILPLRP